MASSYFGLCSYRLAALHLVLLLIASEQEGQLIVFETIQLSLFASRNVNLEGASWRLVATGVLT
jgi:hypothetical protein